MNKRHSITNPTEKAIAVRLETREDHNKIVNKLREAENCFTLKVIEKKLLYPSKWEKYKWETHMIIILTRNGEIAIWYGGPEYQGNSISLSEFFEQQGIA